MVTPGSLCLVVVAFGVCTNAQGAFYPFGSAAGDTFIPHGPYGSHEPSVSLIQPLRFFSKTYERMTVSPYGTLYLPDKLSTADYIFPLLTSIDYRERGNISYQQYTSGEVLHTATRDINSYFPDMTFNATWVFVVTWDRVFYDNYNDSIKNDREATFQVVLISDRDVLFIFMNYGDITHAPQQPGILLYYFRGVITIISCFPNGIIDYVNLNTSSNINVPGRWVLPTSLEMNFTFCPAGLYASLVVPAPDEPTITPFPQAEQVVGMSLTVSSAERLNETVVEEQILPKLREELRQRGIDVSWIRLRRMIEEQP